jgi:hypothetical protein
VSAPASPQRVAVRELYRVTKALIERHPDDWLNPPDGAWRVLIAGGASVLLVPDRRGSKRKDLVARPIPRLSTR